MSNFSSYGNSSGVRGCEGVIDLGDIGDIGFGDIGDIGFGDIGDIGFDVGVGVGVVIVSFLIDFGRPQTSDSVELTNSSFGLLGSHICAFTSGDTVVGEVGEGDGEVGEGDGEVGNGNTGEKGDCSSSWA